MRLLLDTHIVLWQLSGQRTLSPAARVAVMTADALVVSAVSVAEIGVKAGVGKLTVPDDLIEHLLAAGMEFLALSPEHGLAVAHLPALHRDPFDRLLIAQAQQEDLTILTADQNIMAYDVRSIAA